MAAVTLDGVRLALGGRTVLDGITLSVAEGSFTGLLGANGSGKTTLIRALLGLVRPAAGRITVLGRAAAPGASAIGYMPQHRATTAALRLRGWDVVAAAAGSCWGLPLRSAAECASVDAALDLVEASVLARRRLGDLSGGERQRLLLAQALLGQPRLLLLDEPLMSLDPRHQSGIVDLVRRLQTRLALTVILSAHELTPLLPALDQVLYLGNGHGALGPVDEIVTGPVLSRLYGAPIEVVRTGGRYFVLPVGADGQGTHVRV